MSIKTITINTCDRCGFEQNAAEYMNGNQWGQTNLSWKGDTGGRAYDGAAGGVNHEGKAWLCMSCTDDFLKFMKGQNHE